MVPPGVRKLETTLKGNSTLRKKQSLRVVPLALCGRSVERAKSVHGSQSESGQSLKKPPEPGPRLPGPEAHSGGLRQMDRCHVRVAEMMAARYVPVGRSRQDGVRGSFRLDLPLRRRI